jgi:DNA polymerase-4
MDAFFASVEQLTRPTLAGRPVLVGRTGARGTVAAASYEARVFGAHSAMPLAAARRACPAAVVLPPRIALYRAVSATVMSTLAEVAPGPVEQVSLDEAFLDLAGGSADAEGIEAACGELRARVRSATGLACSIGAGSGKQYAKIASRLAKPDGQRVLRRTEERPLLHGLPVRALWGVGPVAEGSLNRIGVRTIGQLAALGLTDVIDQLGEAAGRHLHGLARGVDERAVAPRAEAKQVSAETTFEQDLAPGAALDAALAEQARHAHARLAAAGRAARTATVKVRSGDFATVSRSASLAGGTDDPDTLLGLAQELLPAALAAGNSAERGVRLLGVAYSGLEAAGQDELFTVAGGRSRRAGAAAAETGEAPPDALGVFEVRAPAAAHARSGSVPNRPGEAGWSAGMDVRHEHHGYGWVQGAGVGRVTVRFETRSTGPGRAASFAVDDPCLQPADALDSLG